MKRTFALMALLIALTAAPATADQIYYVAVTEARIRAEPSMEAETRAYTYRNDCVMATGETSGPWIRVVQEPVSGWMHVSLLSLHETQGDRQGTIIGNGRVRLRDAPGGNPVDWVQPGDAATVQQTVDHAGSTWHKVQCNGLTGWVSGEYLVLA